MAAITHRLRYEILESRRLATADALESVGVTVESSAMEGLRSAEIRLKYDPLALDLSAADIRPGKAWDGHASVVSHIDKEAGDVNIFLFSTEPIDSRRGALVDLHFDVGDTGAAGLESTQLAQVRLNEGAIEASSQLKAIDGAATEQVIVAKACAPWPTAQ